jgi:glucosylceramidase
MNIRPVGWIIAVATCTLTCGAVAQRVEIIVSSRAGDRLAIKRARDFRQASQAATFIINDSITYQRIDGFGASFLEAGLIVLRTLPPNRQEEVLRTLFSAEQGAGFSAMKTPIAATDFMSAGPWYTYDDVPGDTAMNHFSIARDLRPNGLVTFIRRARRYGEFQLQAPMDYPPDWMLIDANKKQNVKREYYPALAHYYLRYLQEYDRQGIVIDYLSLFNEPGIYTKIPYSDIRVLLRDHVGPLITKEFPKTKLMLSEAPNRRNAFESYPVVLDDPQARKFVAIAPYHGYGEDYDLIGKLHSRYPDLSLWMSEVCYAYEAGTPKSMKLPRYDFEDGDFWGQQIFNDLENYASAWIYWNMILDEKGGPWAVSPIHGNPDPNIQQPVVIINRATGRVSYTGLFYYLAHFSKFVRPGGVRIQSTGAAKDVRVIAFKLPGEKIVTQLMNSSNEDAVVAVGYHQRVVELKLPALSITTARWTAQ